ncbi:MAG TPA: hypothetical protein VNH63_02510, partial [Gemmatimonadales bacterium]|nr:hypothetical protein [Gemmatimonadales bacterium]
MPPSVSPGLRRVDARDDLLLGGGIEAAHGARIDGGVERLRYGRRQLGDHAAQLRHVAADLDAELFQQELAHGAAGHAGGGLTSARALEDVARVG